MADWRTVTDSEVDPDAPVTSNLMYALRDNPIAIAEGASGAPVFRRDGHFNVTSGNTLIVPVFNLPAIPAPPVGGGGFYKNRRFMTIGSGSLRFWSQNNVTGSVAVSFQIRVGGVVRYSVGIGNAPDAIVTFSNNQFIDIGANLSEASSMGALAGFRIGASTMNLPIIPWDTDIEII